MQVQVQVVGSFFALFSLYPHKDMRAQVMKGFRGLDVTSCVLVPNVIVSTGAEVSVRATLCFSTDNRESCMDELEEQFIQHVLDNSQYTYDLDIYDVNVNEVVVEDYQELDYNDVD